MTQDQALDILKTGANVFLTGEPGSGKTYTINQYVSYLRARKIEPAITASTGIAATHIHGMTIHAWSGIGIKKKLSSYELDALCANQYVVRRIEKTSILIIDEVSMVDAVTLDTIDQVCREIRRNDQPFGGMQVIFVGDFFQLPPVSKDADKASFAFEAAVWKRMSPIVCYLSEQHRQEDGAYLDFLTAFRKRTLTDDHRLLIEERVCEPDAAPDGLTKLFSHNVDVDMLNNTELSRIDDETRVFTMMGKGKEALVAALKRGCLSPENLVLKVGAKVMFTKNNPREYFVNGTQGEVVGFQDSNGYPIVMLKDGKEIVVEPMDWAVEENGKIKASITQIPLRLAWAITIHKSQGMSLDGALMDLSQVFEFGQGYVALSRVRTLSGLYLLGMSDQALLIHPEVLVIDDVFRENSAQARDAFAKLSADELQTMHANFVRACGGQEVVEKKVAKKKSAKKEPGEKAYDVSEIRKTHAKAFARWTAEEDTALEAMYKAGETSIPKLAKHFGRREGGVEARLEKLGLIPESGKFRKKE
jgi:ATP-dependent DNA helicase PIF1